MVETTGNQSSLPPRHAQGAACCTHSPGSLHTQGQPGPGVTPKVTSKELPDQWLHELQPLPRKRPNPSPGHTATRRARGGPPGPQLLAPPATMSDRATQNLLEPTAGGHAGRLGPRWPGGLRTLPSKPGTARRGLREPAGRTLPELLRPSPRLGPHDPTAPPSPAPLATARAWPTHDAEPPGPCHWGGAPRGQGLQPGDHLRPAHGPHGPTGRDLLRGTAPHCHHRCLHTAGTCRPGPAGPCSRATSHHSKGSGGHQGLGPWGSL